MVRPPFRISRTFRNFRIFRTFQALPGLLSAVFLPAMTLPRAVAQTYTLSDLPPLPWATCSDAHAVNNKGQVVGESFRTPSFPHAVLWENGHIRDLGTLPGDIASIAYDINDAGQVVGWSGNPSLQVSTGHAFLWQDGVMSDLGSMLGHTYASAQGINAAGAITGVCGENHVGGFTGVGFVWDRGTATELPPVTGRPDSRGMAINILQQVAGSTGESMGGLSLAAFWDEEAKITQIGGPLSWTEDLNDGRLIQERKTVEIVGTVESVFQGAYLWQRYIDPQGHPVVTSGPLGKLGGYDSRANAVNESGWIVGSSSTRGVPPEPSGPVHAVLWTRDANETLTLKDLNTLIPADTGWMLDEAEDVNDSGQIVGHGNIAGEGHGFLLGGPGAVRQPSILSALRVAGGRETVTQEDCDLMDVVSTGDSAGRVTVADAVRLTRLRYGVD